MCRLVALTYLKNENNLPIVNHIDENKKNDHVDNLEWCSYSYNNSYNGRAKKTAEKKYKKVLCLETGVVYESITEAGNATKTSPGNICYCCKGILKTAGGYHWEYCYEF